jgi:hypothetical protein
VKREGEGVGEGMGEGVGDGEGRFGQAVLSGVRRTASLEHVDVTLKKKLQLRIATSELMGFR